MLHFLFHVLKSYVVFVKVAILNIESLKIGLYNQVLELGMNFLTADDMGAILAVKLRKRLGFGMWAKLHITGMHVEGKVGYKCDYL